MLYNHYLGNSKESKEFQDVTFVGFHWLQNQFLTLVFWIRQFSLIEKKSNTKYLFAKENGTKEKGGQYEEYLFNKLRQIRNEQDGLISKNINVE